MPPLSLLKVTTARLAANGRRRTRPNEPPDKKKQARLDFDAPWMKLGKVAEGFLAVDKLGDESIERIREKELLYEQAVHSGDYLNVVSISQFRNNTTDLAWSNAMTQQTGSGAL